MGLGNPVLGDDGVGWRIVDALERRLAADPATRPSIGAVELDRLAVGGFSLMERLVGYDRVVIADAVVGDGRRRDGLVGPLADGRRSARRATSTRPTTRPSTWRWPPAGRSAPACPTRSPWSASAARRVDEFDECLSPAVAAAVGPAVEAVLAALARPSRVGALMHEFGIAQQIVDVAVRRAEAAGATRITDVLVELGDESGVAAESLELYWPQASRSTLGRGGAAVGSQVAEDPWACRVVAIDVADGARGGP